MSVLEHLASRRSVSSRAMTGPGPSPDEIERIVSLATRVPDHGKLTPWRVQVVVGDAQRALADVLAAAYAATNPDAETSQVEFEAGRASRSPLLLVVSTRLVEGGRIPVVEQLMSAGAVCMNVVHAAHGLGYAAQWVTGWPAYDDTVKSALGIAPGDHLVGWIHVGSGEPTGTDRPRPAVADVMTYWPAPAE